MPKVDIQVPKSIFKLSEKDQTEIMGVLAKAVRLPATMPIYHAGGGDEHDMWSRNGDHLFAEVEDGLTDALTEYADYLVSEVFIALDLPLDGIDLTKSMEVYDLLKAKNKRRKMSELIQMNKEKREKFIKYVQDMNPFSRDQLKKLDDLMKLKLPKYAELAEDFITRAGFIGKIRNIAEQEAFNTMGALIDRFPSTIKAAKREGVVLTSREKDEKRELKVLPLTPQESRAVQFSANHAAEKMAEVSLRQQQGIKTLVMQAQRERWEPSKLAQALFDAYGDMNRDWRRVAITELAFAANDAYLAGCAEGDQLVGMGSEDACKHCKKLVIGKTFTVLKEAPKRETAKTDKENVWVGKSNYGLKTSAWRACTPVHPLCRCRWHRISRFYKVDEDGKHVLKTTAELIQEELARRGLPPDPNLK